MKVNIKSINPFIYRFALIYFLLSILELVLMQSTIADNYNYLSVFLSLFVLMMLIYDGYCVYSNRKFLKKLNCLNNEINLRLIIIGSITVLTFINQFLLMSIKEPTWGGIMPTVPLIPWLILSFFMFNYFSSNPLERERAIVLCLLPVLGLYLLPLVPNDKYFAIVISFLLLTGFYMGWKWILPTLTFNKSSAYWSYYFYGQVILVITYSITQVFIENHLSRRMLITLLIGFVLSIMVCYMCRRLLSPAIADNYLLKAFTIVIVALSQFRLDPDYGLSIIIICILLILIEGGIDVWLRKCHLLFNRN